MEVKCLEIRDRATFIPVICIRPVAANEAQRYLLRRDGYVADESEQCIIMIDAQCRGVCYEPNDWPGGRTMPFAHDYIAQKWSTLIDGDVIDVEFIRGETVRPKVSERWWNALEGQGQGYGGFTFKPINERLVTFTDGRGGGGGFDPTAFADHETARAACEAGYLPLPAYLALCEQHGWRVGYK